MLDRLRSSDTGKLPFSKSHILALPATLWFGIFLVIPLLVIFMYSFLTYESFSVVYEFTLEPWTSLLTNPTVGLTFAQTLLVGAAVTILTLLFGYPLAYYLRFYTSQNGGIILLLFLVIPFWTYSVIRIISWIPILGRNGVINYILLALGIVEEPVSWLLYSTFSQMVGYLQQYVVFMIAPIYISLSQIDEDLLEASETLGGDPIDTFRHVTFPQSLPGVAIGVIFVFVLSIGNFPIPRFLSGGESTVTTLIFFNVNNGLRYPSAAVLSIALLVVIFAIVYAIIRVVDITAIARR
jgi:ABC-type spermidine/putrescine transport system permease subunit I